MTDENASLQARLEELEQTRATPEEWQALLKSEGEWRDRAATLERLLERLVEEIPADRGNPGCYFCGGERESDMHQDDCIWMLARELLN